MKILIAILSCQRDRHLHTGHRDSWMNDVRGADVRFFFGGIDIERQQPDEVVLDVADDYISLPFKTQAMCQWAEAEGYDFVFKADVDTVVFPIEVLASKFEQHDYIGADYQRDYASGAAYWLSRRAVRLIAAAQFTRDDGRTGEDVQVGRLLRDNGIQLHKDTRYRLTLPERADAEMFTLNNIWLRVKTPNHIAELYRHFKRCITHNKFHTALRQAVQKKGAALSREEMDEIQTKFGQS